MILTDCIREDAEYRQLLQAVEQNFRSNPLPILVNGLCEGATDAFLISLIKDIKEKHNTCGLLICSEERDCVRTVGVLNRFGVNAAFYVSRDLTFYNITASHEYEHDRLRVLSGLCDGIYDFIVTTPDAALGYTVPKNRLQNTVLKIRDTDSVNLNSLSARLLSAGFVRVDLVDSPGQFAIRGGIVDIYPPYGSFCDSDGGVKSGAFALRLELFGEEIDRMGLFDPDTQRVTDRVVSAILQPAREILVDKEALAKIRTAVLAQRQLADKPDVREELEKELSALSVAENGGSDIHFADKYISLIYPEKQCLLDYFEDRIPVILQGTNAIRDRQTAGEWHLNETVTGMLESGLISHRFADYAKPPQALDAFCDKNVTLHLDSIAVSMSGRRISGIFSFRTRHTVSYADREDLFLEDLHGLTVGGYRVLILCENEAEENRWQKTLKEANFLISTNPESPSEWVPGTVALLGKEFLSGFELSVPKIAVVSLIPEERVGSLSLAGKSVLHRKKAKGTKNILSYAELDVGDYVVHETYGIGQYVGIQTLTCAGVTKDYIAIQYAGSDKLYLSVEKLDKVSKYIGAHADDGLVKLSKMGGDAWKKSKARAKATVKDMAKDLIRLYAERMRRPGHAFPGDDKSQKEFEDAFPYEETESQLQAAEEIKTDMTHAVPMDRLLCGDVGYGKTEVALRAAYKAVLGGKQVAILVPTTLLALQHYQTIVSRMRSFAVSVEMLSRFRTAKEQTQALRRLSRGDVDILVGTHRLLSKDVKFHDLGLVIVDEEQRFGVAQKEKLKQISEGVDVLSLSATPIPRTLNMAMGGIRDISILDEAPMDRLPVQTYVLEKDPLIIEEAIRRELRRGGQVFYLHNDVETIDSVASEISEAIPEARVTVAHGKMDKDYLEHVWEEMLDGNIDILVCTTIIETGVDVPNANTLIVSNAHRLGLSQLHQIRGRIGRSSRRAYAYFTYPPYKAVSEIARKRLEAIREYAEFGAGFKIALRDMEIRGAGNILGAEQHGHMDAIGYDLYIKLLNQAVLEEKGLPEEETVDCTVSLNYNAYLPEKYVPYPAQRMSLYKRIALISSPEDLSDVADELADRYGDVPKEAENLLRVALIHSTAAKCKILNLREDNSGIHVFPQKLDIDVWSELAKRYPNRLRILMMGEPHIIYRPAKEDAPLTFLYELFEAYLKIEEEQKK